MNYDCFLFSQELEILELRLQILESVVDKFVIGECPKSFTQLDKPMVFQENSARFARWKEKITYVEIPASLTFNAVDQETYQRNYLRKGIPERLSEADKVGINDCDEIPSPFAWSRAVQGVVGLDAYLSQFFLNLEVIGQHWPHMRICSGDFANDHSMYEIRWPNPEQWLPNGGWHFNCAMSPDAIARKCLWFAHAEGATDLWKSIWQNPDAVKCFIGKMSGSIKYMRHFSPTPLLPSVVTDQWDSLIKKGLILP